MLHEPENLTTICTWGLFTPRNIPQNRRERLKTGRQREVKRKGGILCSGTCGRATCANTDRLDWSTAGNGSLGSLMTICDCQSCRRSRQVRIPRVRKHVSSGSRSRSLIASLTQTFISEQSPEDRCVGGKGWVTLLWNRRGLQVRYRMTGCCHHWFISQRSLLKFLSEKRQRRVSQCQSWISRLQTQVKRRSAADPRLFHQNKNLSALNLNVLTKLARIAIGIAWASGSLWKAFALNIAIYCSTTKLQSVIVLTSQLLLDVYTFENDSLATFLYPRLHSFNV